MKYALYVIGVFALAFALASIYYNAARNTYRKRYGK